MEYVANEKRYSNSAIEEKKGMIIFSPLEQGIMSNRYLNRPPRISV